ncbi:MAG: transporter related [Verrucomicrobiales bacterium]|nr:transporter related [Verrucomicrobiales bacterium]
MSAPPTTNTIPSLCRWALGYAFRRWLALTSVLGTMLLKTGVELLKPWPMVFLVDYVLQHKAATPALQRLVDQLPGASTTSNLILWSVAATAFLFVLSWIVEVADAYANVTFGQRIVYDLAADLFAKLQRLSLRFHAGKSVGDNIRRVTSDCNCVSVIVKDAMLPMVTAVVTLVLMFIILWRNDPTLTLFSMAIVPLMGLAFFIYAKPMIERGSRQQEIEGRAFGIVEQTFAAIPIVQAYGLEPANERRLQTNLNESFAATMSLTNVQLQFKLLIGTATSVGTAGVLWIAGRHGLAGTMSVGTILLFLSYLGSLYTPLQSIMYTSSVVQSTAGSARRVLEVLQAQEEIADQPNALALPPIRGRVQFENVTVGYQPARPVLHNITLDVHPGETIALIGASGAGKSTLISLVPRFLDPGQGRVLIDGKDIRDVQLKTLRYQVAIVSQEPFLFPISIAANIAYGSPQATRAQIEAAAKVANADSFIQRLPKQYDTIIGERGATLSAGERQRLSIARALLKDAPILILDEPTSALDAETEAALLQALRQLTKNRTTFLISHRLSTARLADRIVVMNAGQIAEVGTEAELLARQGLYFTLYNSVKSDQ